MSKGPKITIITACYNAEKTIEQTIQSVLSQTYDNIEYIIVDGASTDGTMEIVRKYESQIDTIISGPDEGVYDAFNKGARAATGDYIQYLNADDYLYSSDVIQNVSNFIEQNNEIVLLYGGVLSVDEEKGREWVVNKEVSYDEIQNGVMIPHQAAFLKTKIFEEMNFFDIRYKIVADYDLICKVYKKYSELVFFYPILVSVFRSGGISSEFSNIEKISEEKIKLLTQNFGVHNYRGHKLNNEEYYKRWIEKQVYANKTIGELLVEQGKKKVALWGTGDLSVLISRELVNKGIDIVFYLDNDTTRHQYKINNLEIFPPKILTNITDEVECIIMSFEGAHEESVLAQIDEYNLPGNINILSWRDLIKML